MVEHNKRKKFHDKDKYYRLAKEQGLRSRAAFKLTQINRKFRLLENAKIVLDLCAAPGGWTQVCSRSMPRGSGSGGGAGGGSSTIVAVDILPIRPINPNVITLIGDITTEKTKSQIRSTLQNAPVDVVLCDGAPNVGASYDRDAYQQNEIALHALKCATEHLKKNGSFVTKLYRSGDYSSYLWVAKHFFNSVQAVKPAASRSQSAEIFLVCQGYVDPTSIDPRMLDPKCVFEQVDGAATGGGDALQSGEKGSKMNIFHKQYNQQKRPNRQGYDMTVLDATMRNVGSVSDFVGGVSGSGGGGGKMKDPIRMLGECTGLSFTCAACGDNDDAAKEENESKPKCHCKFYLEHPKTTPEIKACVSDLKVLNKSDFKGLLTWRIKMQEAAKLLDAKAGGGDDEAAAATQTSDDEEGADEQPDSEAEEEGIQAEIEEVRKRKLRERKRQKKKEREVAAKRRRRAALGMDLNAVDVPDNDKIFSLASITNAGDLEAAREVDLAKVRDEDIFPTAEDGDDEDGSVYGDDGQGGAVAGVGKAGGGIDAVRNAKGEIVAQGEQDDLDESTGYSYRLDRELDAAYDRYLSSTKDGMAKSGTKAAKRTKKLQRQKTLEEAREDEEMMGIEAEGIDRDTQVYAKMLQGPKDSDDDSSSDEDEANASDDDDGFHSTPLTPDEHAAARKEKKQATGSSAKGGAKGDDRNPLIHRLPDEPTSVKTARWFSNPLFESIENAALAASVSGMKRGGGSGGASDMDDSDTDEEELARAESEDEEAGSPAPAPPSRKKRKKGEKGHRTDANKDTSPTSASGISADDVLAMMPKTDKQVRHERRKKALERLERKKARRARQAGEGEGEFEVAPAAAADDGEDDEDILNADEKLNGLDAKERKKILDARALIKAGMGATTSADDGSGGFEVVSAAESKKAGQGPLPIMDVRKYDSDNEDYDSDDYAQTLALGTMMLRQSKAKALVDASYNRYAWNDPEDLPDWFVDDENKHYRPQLPIPPALLAKMKEKLERLSTKPIAKVAEARARKNKRARSKLAAAKKKAEAVANSSEMSEAMKLKAISKAMRGQDASKPGKTYVVSKKGGGTRGSKGVKLVDKRMKNDKRSMDRAASKRKGGKKGGLTGSKRRRHHK